MNFDIYNLEDGFLGINKDIHSDFDASSVVVQSIPFEQTSSLGQGSKDGPLAIINASHFVEYFDEELGIETVKKIGISTLKPINCDKIKREDIFEKIEKQTLQLLRKNKFIVSLGAEHTVTYPLVKSFLTEFNDLSILQIDAHADLRNSYNDDIYSHACVMRRVFELTPDIIQLGIRALSLEEKEWIDKHQILTFFAHSIQNNKHWVDDILDNTKPDIYITIDTDGFDPSIMPATGTPEPNGLMWQQVITVLKRVFKEKNVVGIDVVECSPIKGQIHTEYNLAKLIYKLIGYKFIS